MKNKENMMLFALESAQILGEEIASKIGVELSPISLTKFSDGELLIKSTTTVRGKEVFIVSSTSSPVNDNIMQLLIFCDSLKRASAGSITLVMPYYGYARQDRKAHGREPITSKLIADLLQVAGVTKVISLDLHNPSIQGFFNIPVDDLQGQYIISADLHDENKNFVVVSPDHGGAVRARVLSDLLGIDGDIAIVDKRRTGPNKAEVMGVLGDVDKKDVVIIDDMIDTGGTIVKAAEIIKKHGAKSITIAATHGLFSKGFDHFENCDIIDKVIITNSIQDVYKYKDYKKMDIISIADFFAQSIEATYTGGSMTNVYTYFKNKAKGK